MCVNLASRAICSRFLYLLLSVAFVPNAALAQQVVQDFPGVKGQVNALAKLGNTLYVGGYFDYAGLYQPGGAALDPTLGRAMPGFPKVGGYLYAIAPDGAGGWFVGGEFTSIGGQPRTNVAHVLADFSVDAWDPRAYAGRVWAIAVSGGTVYLGGAFDHVGGVDFAHARSHLAAVDAVTGALNSWDPSANGTVRALVASGGVIYAGGDFTMVGGYTRRRIVALSPASGVPTAWDPNATRSSGTPSVYALAVDGSTVYAGGTFTSIGGQPRVGLAALDAITGAATAWDPAPAGASVLEIDALVADGAVVYAGGNYTSIGGQLRNHAAALDAATGAATAWNANPFTFGPIRAIAKYGSTVYLGGEFSSLGGQARTYIGAVDAVTGAVTPWSPNSIGTIYAIAPAAGSVIAAGVFNWIGGEYRNSLVAIDLATRRVTSWDPGVNGGIGALKAVGGSLLVGGDFTTAGGSPRNHIAMFDGATGVVSSWNPNANGTVDDFEIVGDLAYAAGTFNVVGGQPAERVTPISLTTGLGQWNGFSSGEVMDTFESGGLLYAAGSFGGIGGVPRPYIAALNAEHGYIESWNPTSDNTVRTMTLDNGQVYVGGDFSFIGGQTRTRIAALDLASGQALPWAPAANGPPEVLLPAGDRVYAAGTFTTVNGQARRYLAAIDAATGATRPWDVQLGPCDVFGSCGVHDVLRDGTTLYVGGRFSSSSATNLVMIDDATLVAVPAGSAPAIDLALEPIRPNPLAQDGRLGFVLPRAGRVTLELIDPAGRRVRALIAGVDLPAGRHEARLAREGLAPGLYFARLRAGTREVTRRFAVLH